MRTLLLTLTAIALAGAPARALAASAPRAVHPVVAPHAASAPKHRHAGRGHGLPHRHARPKRTLSGLLNLNQASAQELGLFPGMGARKVKAVIAARPYAASFEVGKVRGVGSSFFTRYQDHLRVDGPTTLTWLTATPALGRAAQP